MKEIDWSKAPEGATHWDGSPGRAGSFMKVDGESVYYWPIATSSGFDWETWPGDPDEHFIPRPAVDVLEWNGEGLPPVGIKVEFLGSHGGVEQWKEARVVAHDNGFAVLRYLTANYFAMDADKVRPIRTPEQIAAEEREATVQQMIQDIGVSDTDGWDHLRCAALYDAGYRKQVTP